MKRYHIVVVNLAIGWLALACGVASADRGYCRVLSESPSINGPDFAHLRALLYDAFDMSPANDGSYLFIIKIQPELGADIFQLTRGGIAGPSSFTIAGGSVHSLRAGVAEFARWFQRFGHEPLNDDRQKVSVFQEEAKPATIPVTAALGVNASDFAETGQLPMTITVTNGLETDLNYSSFGLRSLVWNGETAGISLVNIRRDGEESLRYEASPIINTPLQVAGFSNHTIRPGETLTIQSDAAKWTIRGGWKPGKYTVDARVENLSVDDGRCSLKVMSEPFRFEIK